MNVLLPVIGLRPVSVPRLASGDPALFMMLIAGVLLVGAALGLAVAGVVLMFSRNPDRRRLGHRFLLVAGIPLLVAVAWWLAVVGFD